MSFGKSMSSYKTAQKLRMSVFLTLIFTLLAFSSGCIWYSRAAARALLPSSEIETSDTVWEETQDGREIIVRYKTYKKIYTTDDLQCYPNFCTEERIVKESVEICVRDKNTSRITVIKDLGEDKEFKDVRGIIELTYNRKRNLFAFRSDPQGISYVIAGDTGKILRKFLGRSLRWSPDGEKLSFTWLSSEKEEVFR